MTRVNTQLEKCLALAIVVCTQLLLCLKEMVENNDGTFKKA
jgi:hypothetical protein